MQLKVGTSGYAYKEWKGTFYPDDLKAAGFLAYYASKFKAVEINNTFYRMPTEKLLTQWAEQVPDDFTFILKAPQRLTHFKRLKECGEDLQYFCRTAGVLGARLGPTLFQLPPNFKKDLARLQDFLALLPTGWKGAWEFRHESWFDDDVFATLKAHDAALVIAETEPEESPLRVPYVQTADWGYLRLRRVVYTDDDLKDWVMKLRTTPWSEACVFFKHEDAGTGPRLAAHFLELFAA